MDTNVNGSLISPPPTVLPYFSETFLSNVTTVKRQKQKILSGHLERITLPFLRESALAWILKIKLV